jgi:hypothetical protein
MRCTKELPMTQENEAIFRKSLDDVARIKRRQNLAFVVLLFTLMIGLVWLGRLSANPAIDVKRMLLVAVCFLVFLMTYVAMGIAMVVTKMTTKVLSSIELASKG